MNKTDRGRAPLPDPSPEATRERSRLLELTAAKLRIVDGGGDNYQILGVVPDAKADEITAAFRKEVDYFSPNRYPEAGESLKHRLERVVVALAEAHFVLADAERRAEYDSERASAGSRASGRSSLYTSRGCYDLGLRYTTEGDHERAVQAFQRAAQLAPLDAEVHLALGRALARFPGRHKQAEKAFLRAAEVAAEPADILVELGALYARYGRESAATTMYERALVADPKHEGALAALGRRTRGRPGGLFAALFRKRGE